MTLDTGKSQEACRSPGEKEGCRQRLALSMSLQVFSNA